MGEPHEHGHIIGPGTEFVSLRNILSVAQLKMLNDLQEQRGSTKLFAAYCARQYCSDHSSPRAEVAKLINEGGVRR